MSPPIHLPKTNPIDDRSGLWNLQERLLQIAENRLGPRDAGKKIYQPSWSPTGPRIRNTPNMDGAYAELHPSAENSWHFAVFQLAHETVHLLNPASGYVTWLEEGMAVEFSLHALELFELSPIPIAEDSYLLARDLVNRLPGGAFEAGKIIRNFCGSFQNASSDQMSELFPACETSLLEELCRICIPR
ncbi:hypothetical protein BH10ACI2_BH10ACI2_12460 [soil metagenome]